MRISIGEAEPRLDELLDRAETGEEIILTDEGRPVVWLETVKAEPAVESVVR